MPYGPSKLRSCASFVLLLCLLLASFGCGGGNSTSASNPGVTLNAITVTASVQSPPLGTTAQLSAAGSFSNGTTQNLTSSVTWSSSAQNVATVSNAGVITTVAQGTTTITATYNGTSSTFSLTVSAPALVSLAISPLNPSVAVNTTQQFTATGTYTDHSTQVVSGVTWTSSAPAVATISASGLLTPQAQAGGSTSVTAALNGISTSTSVTLLKALVAITVSPQSASVPAGLTQQFSATGTFSDGSTQILQNVAWSSSDNSLASINSSGLATAVAQGSVRVSANVGASTGSASFTIAPPALTGITISPANLSQYIGTANPAKIAVAASFTDGSSSDVTAAASYAVSNPFVASIAADGAITAVRGGLTQINASYKGFSNSMNLTVLEAPRYFYGSTDAGYAVQRFAIDGATGQLQARGYFLTHAGITAPNAPANSPVFPYVSIDPLNQFIYAAHSMSNQTGGTAGQIEIFSVDVTTGDLNLVAGSPFAVDVPLGRLVFEPTGKFAYAVASNNAANNQLITFSRDTTTGILTKLNAVDLAGEPTTPAVDPLGRFLYVGTLAVNSSTQAMAYGYSIDPATGSLNPITGTPFQLSNKSGGFSFHPAGNAIYMSNSGGTSVDTYTIDPVSGKLTLLPSGTINTCSNPTPMVFQPSGRFAYTSCVNVTSGSTHTQSILSYSVASNGALTQIGSVTLSGSIGQGLIADPSGNFLYTSGISNVVEALSIGQNGVATPSSSIGVHANMMSATVLGGLGTVQYAQKNLYVTALGDNKLATFPILSDGSLGTPTTKPSLLSPFALTGVPWGNALFTASLGSVPNLTPWTLDSSGMPSAGFPVGDTSTPGNVLFDPSGLTAFVTDPVNGVVYTYESGVGGSWYHLIFAGTNGVPIYNAPAGAGAGPMVTDPGGRFLFVANQNAKSITAFQYWPPYPELLEMTYPHWTGGLNSPYADGSPYPTSAKPIAMVPDASGLYLLSVFDDSTLRVFAIDYYYGGHLQQLSTTPLNGQPSAITMDPRGQFVYVADTTGIEIWKFNASDGSLASVVQNPPVSLPNAGSLATDLSGSFFYLTTGPTSNNTGAIYGYRIAADGSLIQIGAGALALVNQPGGGIVVTSSPN
jgi:6-phosphogluconolactonase (cycloisomerase 2 family)